MLHELATGRPAFGAATASAVREAILHRDPGSSPGGGAETATALQRVIAKALEKDPERRYATAAEMRSDLRAIAMGDTTVVGMPAPPAVPFSRRRGVRLGLAVAAAVAVAVAAFFAGRSKPAAGGGRERGGGRGAAPRRGTTAPTTSAWARPTSSSRRSPGSRA